MPALSNGGRLPANRAVGWFRSRARGRLLHLLVSIAVAVPVSPSAAWPSATQDEDGSARRGDDDGGDAPKRSRATARIGYPLGVTDHALTCREQSHVLRGIRRRLCLWGSESGPLALLLHGWLDQGAAWQRVAWRLAARGWFVVAPDHRGHGRSGGAPPGSSYHFTEYVVDVDHLVAWLDRPVGALVGHSMGGTIASLYAGLRPAVPAHLVLLEGLGPPATEPGEAADQLIAHLDAQRAPRAHRPMLDIPAASERLRRLNPGLGPALAGALAARTTEPHPEGGLRWTWDPMHRTRAAVAYDAERHRRILERITAPVDLVMGTRSWYRTLPDLADRIAAIPHFRGRHDVDAGHAVHVDAAERVASIVATGPGSLERTRHP